MTDYSTLPELGLSSFGALVLAYTTAMKSVDDSWPEPSAYLNDWEPELEKIAARLQLTFWSRRPTLDHRFMERFDQEFGATFSALEPKKIKGSSLIKQPRGWHTITSGEGFAQGVMNLNGLHFVKPLVRMQRNPQSSGCEYRAAHHYYEGLLDHTEVTHVLIALDADDLDIECAEWSRWNKGMEMHRRSVAVHGVYLNRTEPISVSPLLGLMEFTERLIVVSNAHQLGPAVTSVGR